MTGRTEQSYIQEIIQLKAENAALKERTKVLEKRLEELERRLRMNSKNSSKPPSTDPPGTTASAQKRKRKKRGDQKGHKPHLKSLFPESMVQRFIPLKAEVCTCDSKNQDPRVDPTNNFAERVVRHGVLWRKDSFGTQSERGARYVERMLTV